MASQLDRLAERLRAEFPEFADSLNDLAREGRAIGVPENLPVDGADREGISVPNGTLYLPTIRESLVMAFDGALQETRALRLNEEVGVVMWDRFGKGLNRDVRLRDLELPDRGSILDEYQRLNLWSTTFQGIRSNYSRTISSLIRGGLQSVGLVQDTRSEFIRQRQMSEASALFARAFLQGPTKR